MKTIVGVSDLQIPYHHPPAVKALRTFIQDWRPDEVICVGDEIDFPQISRWNKGTKGEYIGQVHKHRDKAVQVMEALKVNHVMRSNHGDRLQNYLKQYAPGLADDPDFQYERYMRYDQIGVTYHKAMWQFAPGWLLAHGDEGGLSQNPGETAKKLALRAGKSIFCGHTHRCGLVPHTEAYGGHHTRTIYGFEGGCLMDLKQATYLKSGGANWQLAFGIFFVDGNKVTPFPVFMRPNGEFTWEGRVWK